MPATIHKPPRKKRPIEERAAISPAELAGSWGRDANTILNLIRSGELQAFNTARPGKRPRYLITREAIEAFKTARAVVPQAQSTRGRRAHAARVAVNKYF